MNDEYELFCQRNARRFAMEREAKEELQQLRQPTLPLKQRAVAPGGLVYKTIYNSAPEQLPQEDQWADWNLWADRKIENALHAFSPKIGKALDDLAEETDKALDDLAEALAREREKNVKLRGEVEVLRIMIKSQNIGATMRGRNVT
jgi:hypothetical protein